MNIKILLDYQKKKKKKNLIIRTLNDVSILLFKGLPLFGFLIF